MPNTIKVKRGLAANRTSVTPAAGEFLYTTDTKQVYIGDGTTAGGNSITTPANVQIFTSSGTWTKPAGAQTVTVICIGGGGGGGSGCKGATVTLRSGGGGGGGGGYSVATFKASDIAASVSVTVGAGGTSGASQTVNSSNGNAGGAGGNTTFGSHVASRGGTGGNGGVVNNNSGVAVGGYGVFGIASNGAGSSPNTPSVGNWGDASRPGGAGGGPGGGITGANVIVKGGQGCNTSSNTEPRWIDPASNNPTYDTVTGAGNSGTDLTSASWFGGESGDGGNASSTGNAFAGGNGGKWGGGAGGGGAALDSVGNSGAGGTGGSGLCVVITE